MAGFGRRHFFFLVGVVSWVEKQERWLQMEEIVLVRPNEGMKEAALTFRQAFFDAGEDIINGASLFDKLDTYEDWLAHLAGVATEEGAARKSWVPSSTFFGVRKSDGALVGVIDIRHRLNDFLRESGGHIGYSVLPAERRKGYARQMLALALDYSRGLGVDEVLMGCDADNEASKRTIVGAGGQFVREFIHADDGALVEHYTIRL